MSPEYVKRLIALPAVAGFAIALSACGDPGSSGTTPPDEVTGDGCEPIAGDTLVALEDDQNLQASENVLAAFNSDAADDEAIAAVDLVSRNLTTEDLTGLNKAVDYDRDSPAEAAEQFAAELDFGDLESGSGELVVGHADYSESEVVANLYKVALDEAGYDTELQDVGNRETYLPALQSGEVQVVPEYAASLTEALNPDSDSDAGTDPVASSDIETTMDTLRGFAADADLAVGAPAEASSENAYAVTEAFAAEHGISTLSEFGEECSGVDSVLAGPPECQERIYCQLGLEETYDIQFGQFNALDIGTGSKQSVVSGESTVGTVISTDSALAEDVTVDPEDDKKD